MPAPDGSDGAASTNDVARRARILVVDDEPVLANALRYTLEEHDVQVANSVRDALALLEQGSFDVIVCDLLLPERSGMDLYEELLRRGNHDERRMIFMTGGAYTAEAQAFLADVPNPILDKPFRERVLRAAVEQVLGLHAALSLK
jgi:CheY-like chemotaxis protein